VRRNCDVTRTSRCELLDNLHVAVTHICVIAGQSTPLTLDDSHSQSQFYRAIRVLHASAPPARQRVSDVRVRVTSLFDEPERSIDSVRSHCIEVNEPFADLSFFDDGLQKCGIETERGSFHGKVRVCAEIRNHLQKADVRLRDKGRRIIRPVPVTDDAGELFARCMLAGRSCVFFGRPCGVRACGPADQCLK